MDTIIRGLLGGASGTFVYGVINWILYISGVLPSTTIHYAAVLVSPPNTPIDNFTMLLGLVSFSIGGSALGIGIAYLLKITGYDFAWLKGLGFGTFSSLALHLILLPSLVPRLYPTIPTVMGLGSLILSAIWGIIAALVLQFLPASPEHSEGRY